MADLFGDWVPDEWIQEVFKACERAPQHKYLFLTKNPNRYYSFYDQCPKNFWFGASAVNKPDEKVISNGDGSLSVEPLLTDVAADACFDFVSWVIVGQQTGPGAKPPEEKWVWHIVERCKAAKVPVFIKSPLYRLCPIQEWPEGMRI